MSKNVILVVLLAVALVPATVPTASAQAIPSGTNLIIRLETPLSTERNRVGDPFQATVVEPQEYRGALIRGHIRDIEESGRLRGRTEMALAFDSIQMRRGIRPQPLRAQLVNVYESETVSIVDEEGRVRSGSRTHDTMQRGGIGAAVGGVLGGVLGGGKGALLGVLLGAGAGAGSLFAEGVREIRLDPGTQMEISTGYASRPSALARTDWEQDPRFVADVQNALIDYGYNPGLTNGTMDARTRKAIREFQRDQGLPVTGVVDYETARRLGVQ